MFHKALVETHFTYMYLLIRCSVFTITLEIRGVIAPETLDP